MKITPEYLQQIIQEETNILLFEKRLGRELTTEEIERLREFRGIRSSSEKSAEKAFEKEMEKIKGKESPAERAAADARQKKYDEEGIRTFQPFEKPQKKKADPQRQPDKDAQAATDVVNSVVDQAREVAEEPNPDPADVERAIEPLQQVIDEPEEEATPEEIKRDPVGVVDDLEKKLSEMPPEEFEDAVEAAQEQEEQESESETDLDLSDLDLTNDEVRARLYKKINPEGTHFLEAASRIEHYYEDRKPDMDIYGSLTGLGRAAMNMFPRGAVNRFITDAIGDEMGVPDTGGLDPITNPGGHQVPEKYSDFKERFEQTDLGQSWLYFVRESWRAVGLSFEEAQHVDERALRNVYRGAVYASKFHRERDPDDQMNDFNNYVKAATNETTLVGGTWKYGLRDLDELLLPLITQVLKENTK